MASHDGLRLYLGKYAPDEVLKHIFAYGFHLWLAQPEGVLTDIEVGGREYYGYSTRRYVAEYQLTREAGVMVDHSKYRRETFHNPHGKRFWPTGRARPDLRGEPIVWLRAYPQSDEFWMVPAPHYDRIHTMGMWLLPPPRWDDEDLDDM